MGDSLDEILARLEAATACGCDCDDDYCAYVEKAGQDKETSTTPLPHSAASRRLSVRYLNENPAL